MTTANVMKEIHEIILRHKKLTGIRIKEVSADWMVYNPANGGESEWTLVDVSIKAQE